MTSVPWHFQLPTLALDYLASFERGLGKHNIKVIFAGSSETTLRSMFARPSEPFYNWAGLEPFPLLGEEFVGAMVEKVAGISRHPLALSARSGRDHGLG